MKCLTCDKSIAWHARTATYILETVGPEAEREFEDDHPTDEDEEDE